jgi:hypothetical protein
MAKQTFTVGQVLTAAQLTSLKQTAMGGGSASNKTSSYTLVAADAGTAISMTSTSATTITVNTGLFAAGDTVQITNLGSGVATITAGTATVNTSASLALAQYESGTLAFISTSAAIFIKGAGAAAGGGGKVLQVVSTTKTDTFTTSSTSFVDITGLSVSITPTLNTSKIMVFTSLQASGLADSNSATTRLMRDSTAIFVGDASSSRGQSSADVRGGIGSNRVGSSQAPMTLDAPATTSALTYKVQIRTLTAGSCFVNRGSVDTDNADHTRTASSITVMEIGA